MYRVPLGMLPPVFIYKLSTNKVINLRMPLLGTPNGNAPSHKCIGPNQSWAPQWECTLLTASGTMIPGRFYWDAPIQDTAQEMHPKSIHATLIYMAETGDGWWDAP